MADPEGGEWVLTDWYGSPDGDHVYPRTAIESEEQLRQALGEYSRQEPRILALDCTGEIYLSIGLGGPWGSVSVSLLGGKATTILARASVERARESVIFVGDWQPSPFPPEYLLPAEEVIEIVTSIYRSEALPNWVRWEGPRPFPG